MNLRGRYRSTDFQLGSIQVAFVVACISKLGGQEEVTRVERICVFIPTVLPVLLPSLSILLCFSHLSCLAPLERGRGRMERKRTTMGEAAQIRCKSALPPMVYYPLLASQSCKHESDTQLDVHKSGTSVHQRQDIGRAVWPGLRKRVEYEQ